MQACTRVPPSLSPSMLLVLLQLPQLPLLALTLPVELPESEPDSHTPPPRLSVGHLRRERAEHWPAGHKWDLARPMLNLGQNEGGMKEGKREGGHEGMWVKTNRSVWGDYRKSAQTVALPLWCRCGSGYCCGFRRCCALQFSSQVYSPSLEQPRCAPEHCCSNQTENNLWKVLSSVVCCVTIKVNG